MKVLPPPDFAITSMFASLSEEDWDLVIKVHLKGHFCLASTLVRRWRDQHKAGQRVDARIVNTSSGAGLQGSACAYDLLQNPEVAEVRLADVTHHAVKELDRLGPFGQGNPEPVFLLRNIRLREVNTLASKISNAAGSVTSNVATLTVRPVVEAPSIVIQPSAFFMLAAIICAVRPS